MSQGATEELLLNLMALDCSVDSRPARWGSLQLRRLRRPRARHRYFRSQSISRRRLCYIHLAKAGSADACRDRPTRPRPRRHGGSSNTASRAHQLLDTHQPLAQLSARMQIGKIFGAKSFASGNSDGERIAQRQHCGRRRGWSEPQRAGLLTEQSRATSLACARVECISKTNDE